MAAADEAELVHMVATAVDYNDGPIAFRYPRGNGVGCDLPLVGKPIEIGKGRIISSGKHLAILNFGARMNECKKAAETLNKKGIFVTIFDARFAKPLDEKLILELASNHEAVLTIEEGSIGGFGSHVADFLSKKGLLENNLKFRSLTLPDFFVDQDTPDKMYKKANLDSISIEHKILDLLNSNIILQKQK